MSLSRVDSSDADDDDDEANTPTNTHDKYSADNNYDGSEQMSK